MITTRRFSVATANVVIKIMSGFRVDIARKPFPMSARRAGMSRRSSIVFFKCDHIYIYSTTSKVLLSFFIGVAFVALFCLSFGRNCHAVTVYGVRHVHSVHGVRGVNTVNTVNAKSAYICSLFQLRSKVLLRFHVDSYLPQRVVLRSKSTRIYRFPKDL